MRWVPLGCLWPLTASAAIAGCTHRAPPQPQRWHERPAVYPAEETCEHDPDTTRRAWCTDRVGTVAPGDLPEPYARCPMLHEVRITREFFVATFSAVETAGARASASQACCYVYCAPGSFE